MRVVVFFSIHTLILRHTYPHLRHISYLPIPNLFNSVCIKTNIIKYVGEGGRLDLMYQRGHRKKGSQ